MSVVKLLEQFSQRIDVKSTQKLSLIDKDTQQDAWEKNDQTYNWIFCNSKQKEKSQISNILLLSSAPLGSSLHRK